MNVSSYIQTFSITRHPLRFCCRRSRLPRLSGKRRLALEAVLKSEISKVKMTFRTLSSDKDTYLTLWTICLTPSDTTSLSTAHLRPSITPEAKSILGRLFSLSHSYLR